MRWQACAIAAVVAALPTFAGAQTTQQRARADIKGTTGQPLGEAELAETAKGVLMTLTVRGLLPGPHALHVHQTGRCDPPSFESAGGHFNPTSSEHGFANPKGPHVGDLPNVYVPETQFLKVESFIDRATLSAGPNSLLDADGSAIVLHLGGDDYHTNPAGAAGSRVACGVVARSGQHTTAAAARQGVGTSGAAGPKVITDIKMIILPTAAADLSGRQVDLTKVTIGRVASPRSFWTGETNQELFVRLPENASIELNAGDTVAVAGVLQAVPGDVRPGAKSPLGVFDEKDVQALKNRRVYLEAERVRPAK